MRKLKKNILEKYRWGLQLLLVFVLLSANTIKAQEIKAYTRLDTNTIMIGDQIGIVLGVKLPENFTVNWPILGDTLTSAIEIVKKSPLDTLLENNEKIIKQRLIITSFDSGYFELPPIKFIFHHKNDSTHYMALTKAKYLQVNVPKVDTAKAFKPIVMPVEAPVTFGEVLPWIILGLAVVAIIAFIIYYLKRRKANKPVFARRPKPLPPPDIEAISKLEKLRLARMWQAGKVKEYHTTLTDIMRNYLKRRYNFDAVEMTSDEILEELKKRNINDTVLLKFKDAFNLADLVKFAKANPTALENDQSVYHCIDFVNETKYIPVKTENGTITETKKQEEE